MTGSCLRAWAICNLHLRFATSCIHLHTPFSSAHMSPSKNKQKQEKPTYSNNDILLEALVEHLQLIGSRRHDYSLFSIVTHGRRCCLGSGRQAISGGQRLPIISSGRDSLVNTTASIIGRRSRPLLDADPSPVQLQLQLQGGRARLVLTPLRRRGQRVWIGSGRPCRVLSPWHVTTRRQSPVRSWARSSPGPKDSRR